MTATSGLGPHGPVGQLGHLADVADVVGEGLALDRRRGVVEHHRAALLGQLTGHQGRLTLLHLGLQRHQLVLGVGAPQDREPPGLVERHQLVELADPEHAGQEPAERTRRRGLEGGGGGRVGGGLGGGGHGSTVEGPNVGGKAIGPGFTASKHPVV